MTVRAGTDSAPQPQPVLSPLTSAAIFLVLPIERGGEAEARDLLADLAGVQRSVAFRLPEGQLTCVAGVGSAAWDRLFTGPRPARLHPFRELAGEPLGALGGHAAHLAAPGQVRHRGAVPAGVNALGAGHRQERVDVQPSPVGAQARSPPGMWTKISTTPTTISATSAQKLTPGHGPPSLSADSEASESCAAAVFLQR